MSILVSISDLDLVVVVVDSMNILKKFLCRFFVLFSFYSSSLMTRNKYH